MDTAAIAAHMNPIDKGNLKGCLLSLIAMALGFGLIFPLTKFFNYIGWPNTAAMHGGALIFAWALGFIIIYCLLLLIDRWWHRKSK